MPKNKIYYLFVIVLMPFFLFANEINGNKLVEIETFSDYSIVKKGDTFNFFIKLTPEKDWHTYWLNPGDAGMSPNIEFDLPKGIIAGNPIYENPIKDEFTGMVSFIYESENTLMIPIRVSSDFSKSEINISGIIKWLVCKEECLAGSKKFSYNIKIGQNSILANNRKSITDKILLNQAIRGKKISTKCTALDNTLSIEINKNKLSKDIKKLEFYPYINGYINYSSEQIFNDLGDKYQLILELDKFRTEIPEKISGILISNKNILESYPHKSIEINDDLK